MARAARASANTTLVIRKRISATPADVFKALTNPKVIKQWMGPGDVECVAVEADPRIGGSYRFHMRSDEGDHIAIGKYLEIDPATKLVFTWSWESGTVKDSKVTIDLKASGSKTDLELVHELLPSKDDVEQHTGGWNACLDQLAALLKR